MDQHLPARSSEYFRRYGMMSGPWPYKLLEAAVIVGLWSNTGSYVRRYPQDQNAALVTVAQNESFRTVDPLLLYIHFTDLAYHDPRRHHEGHHHR